MSGGHYDYAYCKVNDFCEALIRSTPERKVFAKLLCNISEAMRAVEWVDSGDSSEDEATVAIAKCFMAMDHELLNMLIQEAKHNMRQLDKYIKRIEKHAKCSKIHRNNTSESS